MIQFFLSSLGVPRKWKQCSCIYYYYYYFFFLAGGGDKNKVYYGQYMGSMKVVIVTLYHTENLNVGVGSLLLLLLLLFCSH